MGSHREQQPPWARFRQWFRYRRFLADLKRDDRRAKVPLTAERVALLKQEARAAARRTGG